MASITSVISIFVLLLATYCYSLPVNSGIDGSTSGIEVTTGQTMKDHENNAHLHLATEEELKKMPNIHPPRASAERDSGEVTTDKPTTTDQDTSSPMPSTSKTPSTEKTNGKRAYYVTYPSLVRLYDGHLATGSVLADGTILTHGPIYTDNSLVSYVTSYKRDAKDEDTSKDKRDYLVDRSYLSIMEDAYGRLFQVESPLSSHVVVTSRDLKDDIPSTPETPLKEEESSTDKQKVKRDYIIQRNLLTPMIDHFGRVFDMESPLSEHLVITRDLKDDIPSTPETPSKEDESSTDKSKVKRDYIIHRNYLTSMVDHFGQLYDVETPLSSHYVVTRDLKDDIPSTPETPLKEGESSTNKQKVKRDYFLQHNYLRLMSDSRGQLYEVEEPYSSHLVFASRVLKDDIPSTSETPSKEGESSTNKQKDKRDYIIERDLLTPMIDGFGRVFHVKYPMSEHLVVTRDLKDDTPSTSETPSKEGEPSTNKQKDKRALYYEDSSLVTLADGTIGRGAILSHGSVLPNGVMLTHGPIYSSRNMFIHDPMYMDGAVRQFVSVDTRGIKDQTNDKVASKEENPSMTGDNSATTMETSSDFEPRAIKPMDGQSGEETSTSSIGSFGKMPVRLGGNKNEKDGSSEESHARLPEKEMSKIPDKTKEQRPDVNVPGSKQPINKT